MQVVLGIGALLAIIRSAMRDGVALSDLGLRVDNLVVSSFVFLLLTVPPLAAVHMLVGKPGLRSGEVLTYLAWAFFQQFVIVVGFWAILPATGRDTDRLAERPRGRRPHRWALRIGARSQPRPDGARLRRRARVVGLLHVVPQSLRARPRALRGRNRGEARSGSGLALLDEGGPRVLLAVSHSVLASALALGTGTAVSATVTAWAAFVLAVTLLFVPYLSCGVTSPRAPRSLAWAAVLLVPYLLYALGTRTFDWLAFARLRSLRGNPNLLRLPGRRQERTGSLRSPRHPRPLAPLRPWPPRRHLELAAAQRRLVLSARSRGRPGPRPLRRPSAHRGRGIPIRADAATPPRGPRKPRVVRGTRHPPSVSRSAFSGSTPARSARWDALVLHDPRLHRNPPRADRERPRAVVGQRFAVAGRGGGRVRSGAPQQRGLSEPALRPPRYSRRESSTAGRSGRPATSCRRRSCTPSSIRCGAPCSLPLVFLDSSTSRGVSVPAAPGQLDSPDRLGLLRRCHVAEAARDSARSFPCPGPDVL